MTQNGENNMFFYHIILYVNSKKMTLCAGEIKRQSKNKLYNVNNKIEHKRNKVSEYS